MNIMKKIISLLFVISALNLNVYSQDFLTFITMNGGFSGSRGKDSMLSSGVGLNFDLALSERVHFNVMPTLNFRGYTGLVTTKPTYIDFPVCFQFSLDENEKHMFLGLGGYYGYALSGKYKNTLSVTGNTDWQKMSFGESAEDNRSKTDYGALLNIGGFFPTYSGAIKAGVQFMTGFKNVVPEARQGEDINNNIKLRSIKAYLEFSIFNF